MREYLHITGEHVITLGLFDRESKKQEISTADAFEMVSNEIAARGFCATIQTAGVYGIYRHGDGTVIREPSMRIEIDGVEPSEIFPLLDWLRGTFNQESILYKFVKEQDFTLWGIEVEDGERGGAL